jgi:hypothetical protein
MSQHYYIMNAACLFDEEATDINGMADTWGNNQTILVCRRQTHRGNELETGARIFVSGSGHGYVPKDMELPVRGLYTQDTGMGHRNVEYGLLIENVIEVGEDENGKRTFKPRNMVGVNERRRGWTMK